MGYQFSYDKVPGQCLCPVDTNLVSKVLNQNVFENKQKKILKKRKDMSKFQLDQNLWHKSHNLLIFHLQ